MGIGLDIGSTSIKIVYVGRQGGSVHLLSAGVVRAPALGMLSDSETDLVVIATTIKKLMADTKISGKEVAVALPESEVVTRVIEMPNLSDQELSSAIEWEAEQYIPMPLSESSLSHEVIERKEGGNMKVLVVASTKKLVEKYLKVCEMAKIKVTAVDTELIALSRSLIGQGPGSTVLVDMGARSTDIAIVSGGRVLFARSLATAGEALTRAVALGLSMELNQAEEYKKTYGLDQSKLEAKVRGAMMPVFEVIVGEVKKAIEFYKSQSPSESIKSIVLGGGTAGLSGLVSELASKLGVEVAIGDPFASMIKDEMVAKALAGYAPLYGVAAGLALRDI